jgi:hypothetical protein
MAAPFALICASGAKACGQAMMASIGTCTVVNFSFPKKYGQPDGRRRRIFSPTGHRNVVRHSSGALCECGGTVTDVAEDGGRKRLARPEGVDLMSDIDHVHHHVGLCGIVERITVDSVEVNETGDYIWMTAADPAQLFTSNRMSGQDGTIELQRLDDYQDIFPSLSAE